MRYAVIPQIYTIIALGTLLVLPPIMSPIISDHSMDGMPRILIHPYFTWSFSLWLTTAIVWFIALAFSLRYIRKKGLKLTEVVRQNLHVISWATFTVFVALSGCVGFSDIYHPIPPGMFMSPLSPLLFYARMIGYLGSFCCALAWTIIVLYEYFSDR